MKRLIYILLTLFSLLLVLSLMATWFITSDNTSNELAGWATAFQERLSDLPTRNTTNPNPWLLILYGLGFLVGLGLFISIVKELGKRFHTDKELSE